MEYASVHNPTSVVKFKYLSQGKKTFSIYQCVVQFVDDYKLHVYNARSSELITPLSGHIYWNYLFCLLRHAISPLLHDASLWKGWRSKRTWWATRMWINCIAGTMVLWDCCDIRYHVETRLNPIPRLSFLLLVQFSWMWLFLQNVKNIKQR